MRPERSTVSQNSPKLLLLENIESALLALCAHKSKSWRTFANGGLIRKSHWGRPRGKRPNRSSIMEGRQGGKGKYARKRMTTTGTGMNFVVVTRSLRLRASLVEARQACQAGPVSVLSSPLKNSLRENANEEEVVLMVFELLSSILLQ